MLEFDGGKVAGLYESIRALDFIHIHCLSGKNISSNNINNRACRVLLMLVRCICVFFYTRMHAICYKYNKFKIIINIQVIQ